MARLHTTKWSSRRVEMCNSSALNCGVCHSKWLLAACWERHSLLLWVTFLPQAYYTLCCLTLSSFCGGFFSAFTIWCYTVVKLKIKKWHCDVIDQVAYINIGKLCLTLPEKMRGLAFLCWKWDKMNKYLSTSVFTLWVDRRKYLDQRGWSDWLIMGKNFVYVNRKRGWCLTTWLWNNYLDLGMVWMCGKKEGMENEIQSTSKRCLYYPLFTGGKTEVEK